jgi:hypothetical protein
MPALSLFENISLQLPRDRIFRRLGFKVGTTELSRERLARVESDMQQAMDLVHLKGAARRVEIERKGPSGVVLANGEVLESKKLVALLAGSSEVLLLAATGGPEIIEAIREKSTGDLARGVVFDAVASEMTDCALDWIAAFFENGLRREGRRLTSRRFSAGYADLALENQRFFYRELELGRIGVQITDSCFLIPEKSVTAVYGIEKSAP